MKKTIAIILVMASLFSCFILTGCDDDSCGACGGSGYFQKRDCPFC